MRHFVMQVATIFFVLSELCLPVTGLRVNELKSNELVPAKNVSVFSL